MRSSASAAMASRRPLCGPPSRPSPASTGRTTARRACARRRGCTTRSRCTIAEAAEAPTRSQTGAAARAREHGDGRCRHRDLGVEVLLRLLASGHRHTRSRSGHGSDRHGDGNPATLGDPHVHAARRAGQQPDGTELHAAVPGLSVGSRRLRRRAVPDAAQVLRTDSIPFTFVSDEFNGVTRDNEGNVRPLMPRSFADAVRRPRRRTARAASISAFTGRSTRPRASPRASASPTTLLPHVSSDAVIGRRGWRSGTPPPTFAADMHQNNIGRTTLVAIAWRLFALCVRAARPGLRSTDP